MCVCVCSSYFTGYYLYTEASGKGFRSGDKTQATSPIETLNGTHCLRFYFNMYGKYMGTLSLHRRVLPRPILRRPLFSISRNQKLIWWPMTIEIPGGDTQLVFEGNRGRKSESDIAIDDISLESGKCNKSE